MAVLIVLLGFLFVRVLGRLVPVLAIAFGLTILGAGDPMRGLGLLIMLLLLALAWRAGRRRQRAERAAAAQAAFIQMQAEANAQAMFRVWEQRQFQRELAALSADEEFPGR